MQNYQYRHNLKKNKIQTKDGNINYTCNRCGQTVITNTFGAYHRDDDTMCKRCGIKRKDHYTYQHTFAPLRPIKGHYCGENSPNPFAVTDRDVPGYDPLAFQYYPPEGLEQIYTTPLGEICGNRHYYQN